MIHDWRFFLYGLEQAGRERSNAQCPEGMATRMHECISHILPQSASTHSSTLKERARSGAKRSKG